MHNGSLDVKCIVLGKGGCSPDEVVDIVKAVRESCDHLNVCGLMTIGAFNHDVSSGPNPDFLVTVRLNTLYT